MVLGRGFKRFPLPMALGNDICRISRIKNALGRGPNKAARFIQRVLTKEEIRGVRDPKVKQWIQDVMSYNKDKAEDKGSILSWVEPMSDDSIKRTSVYLAGRWAAKEAVIKAHPNRRVLFEDILIYSSPESLRRHGKEGESKTKEGQAEGEEVTTSREENDNNMAKEEEKNEVVVDKEGDEVDTRSLGRPVAVVRGRKEIGEEDTEVLISISHDHEYATAVCLSWTDSSSKRGGGRRKEKKPKKATRRKPEQTRRRETEKAMRRRLAEDIVEIGSYTEYIR